MLLGPDLGPELYLTLCEDSESITDHRGSPKMLTLRQQSGAAHPCTGKASLPSLPGVLRD